MDDDDGVRTSWTDAWNDLCKLFLGFDEEKGDCKETRPRLPAVPAFNAGDDIEKAFEEDLSNIGARSVTQERNAWKLVEVFLVIINSSLDLW